MITRISPINLQKQSRIMTSNAKSPIANSYQNQTSVMSLEAANSIKSTAGINFKGNNQLSDLEQSFILDNEIRIPNILDIDEPIELSRVKMPKGKEVLNASGINLFIDEDPEFKTYILMNDKGDTIFFGMIDKTTKELPVITYKQGKFMPEITVKDESLNGKRVKMYAGSHLSGEGFELRMPGTYEPIPGQKRENVSFTGRTVITTLNNEPRTLYAVDKYMNSDLATHAIKGEYTDTMLEYDPTIVIPAGGFGERFRNITRDKENKPSAKMPTHDNYRIIGTALNLAASAGIINADGTDSLKYLSQKHNIEGDNVYYVDRFKTDGGAIAEGLARDIIRNDRDVIILNADIFTNADITRVYEKLKTLPDAGLVIPYYPVNPERAKSFGLLGIEKDENNNLQIKSFVEKPKYTHDAPMPNDFKFQGEYDKAMEEFNKVQTALLPGKDDVFLANPGLYFMSKEAAKVLTASGILSPEETGLGKDIMPKIVEMANTGRLKDSEGNQLKIYTVPLEAKGGKPAVWDDIGTAEAYLRLIKDVAHETDIHGTSTGNKYYGVPEFVLNDFKDNVDLETGIVYGSKESKGLFNNFCNKYGITTARGNIFVTID